MRLAEERLAEFNALLDEALLHTGSTTVATSGSATSTTEYGTVTEAEADVFTDTTIVKVEINDQKYVFSTGATTTGAIAAVIAERFDKSEADILPILVVEYEDRASRTEDLYQELA